MKSAKPLIQYFFEYSAIIFLLLLITGDLAFIALHIINRGLHMINDNIEIRSLFNIEVDRGYAEFYQYTKLLWICALLIYLSFSRVSKHFFAWVCFFLYLLLDDSLKIHENGGGLIAEQLDIEPLFGLRLQDYGELGVAAIAGAILIVPLLWAYKCGSQKFRKISLDITILLSVFIFFSLFTDILHMAINWGDYVDFLFGIIEDGGELISISLVLWYIFLVVIHSKDNDFYLYDLIQIVLKRRSKRREKL